jgi:outer membrane autotransporter protein
MAMARFARRGGVVAGGVAAVLSLASAAQAQFVIEPGYSAFVQQLGVTGATGLLALPGLNAIQAGMAHAVDGICPTLAVNTAIETAAQLQLGTICSKMTAAALVANGTPSSQDPLGLQSTYFPGGGVTVAQVLAALSQLNGGGELVDPTSQASALRGQITSAVAARLSVLHMHSLGLGGVENDDPVLSRVAMNTDGTRTDAPGALVIAQTAPTDVSIWKDRLGIFATGLGQFGARDTTGNANGYSFDNTGLLVGADYRLTPQLVVGTAFAYNHSSTDFDVSPGSPPGQYLHGDLFQGNLYASYYPTNALYIDAVGAIGGGSNDSLRIVDASILTSGVTATGSYGTRTYGLALGGGYNFPMGAWTLTPTARLEFDRVEADGFTENNGGAFDLTYGASAQNAYLSFVGGQAQYAISTSFGVLTPTARFDWAHQYNAGNNTVSIAYANDIPGSPLSAFTLSGDRPDRNYYDLGVGVAIQLADNWSGFLNYDAIVGLSHTTYNSFSAGFRFGF